MIAADIPHPEEEGGYLLTFPFPSDDGDDDHDTPSNSSCAQHTSCTDCVDFYEADNSDGCLWCRVPATGIADSKTNAENSGSEGGGGGGICLPRSEAQDRCEIGELQVRHSRAVYDIGVLRVTFGTVR